jgi:hypothetical protein
LASFACNGAVKTFGKNDTDVTNCKSAPGRIFGGTNSKGCCLASITAEDHWWSGGFDMVAFANYASGVPTMVRSTLKIQAQ